MLKKVSNNLDHYFNIATKENINDGLTWYRAANKEAVILSKKFKISTETAAGVISALSPRNKWHRNIIAAHTVCEAYATSVHPTDVKVSTFHTNKFKAFAILAGSASIEWDSRKTFSFVKNVGRLNPNFVTVDLWHLRACFGKTIGACGKTAYDQITELTIKKAKELGMQGFEYQAIIWCSVREWWQY